MPVDGQRTWTAALVLTGTMLVSFQGGLLRVALPVIRSDLAASIPSMGVVSVAGLVVTTTTVVAFGRLADLVGARRIYSLGLVVFAVGGTMSAVAPSVGMLATAQAIQGLGWSMAISAGTPLLVRAFEPERRGRVVAATHMAVAIGLAAGPAAGGVLIERLGWRWALFALCPAASAVGALVQASLGGHVSSGARPRFDLKGAAALAVALGGLLVALDRTGQGRFTGAGTLLAVVAVAAFVAFVAVELRAAAPMVDLALFANRTFSAGLAASFFNFVAMASNMFLMPFFLQEALGQRPASAGLVMMVVPAGVLVAAPVAGAVADRVGPRLPATVGMALITAAVGLMATFTTEVSVATVVAVLTLYGVGAGLFQSPNITGVLDAAPVERLGVTSGTLSTVGRLGQVVGIAVAGALWDRGAETTALSDAGRAEAFHDAFLALALFGALATVACCLQATRPGVRSGQAEGGGRLGER